MANEVPDLLAIGRTGVDMYPQQVGVPMAEVSTFQSAIGGTATNVAVAVARLGHSAMLVTKVGADSMGSYVKAALTRFGVDATMVSEHPTLPTPVVFAELDPPSDPKIWFYRKPSAPDEHLILADIPMGLVGEVPVLWVPASRFAFQPSRSTLRVVLDSRDRLPHTVLDLDYRPMFWNSEAEASEAIGPMVAKCTVAIGNREECRIAVGSDDPETAARRMLDQGVQLAIVKMGAEGVLVADAEGFKATIAPTPVEVVCGLGAGDAFGGAIVHGLLNGWTPSEMVAYANAAGAIVAARLLCSDDMPTIGEIETMLKTGIVPEKASN
jgi:5-dehydro-2-deoxygluconokinase